MWRWPETMRQHFEEAVDAAEKACTNHPNDTQSKMRLAHALINMAIRVANTKKDMKFFNEAISVLKEVLAMDSEHNEARLLMGIVYYRMLVIDPAWPGEYEDYDAQLDICEKALECFYKVRDAAPAAFKNSFMVADIERYAEKYRGPNLSETEYSISSPPQAEVYIGHEPEERFQDPSSAMFAPPEHTEDLEMGWQDTSSLETQSSLYPDNVEILKKQATSLMTLSRQKVGREKRKLIAEAVAKLEMALSICPNDVEAEKELMEAYDELMAERALHKVERPAGAECGEASSLGEIEVAEQKNIKRRREFC